MISYKDSGVDKEEGYKAVDKIKDAVSRTHNENVLSGLGSFGSFFSLKGYNNPVLVSGTDGVGTKLEIAFKVKKYDTVGQDCFAMCANDILCQGAKPLFFLDYLACGKLDSDVSSQLVGGIAKACEETGCALVGGETAEMPGFYKEGDYDIAGFCVGAVEESEIINGSTVVEGDVIVAIPSNGLHSNGFSLIRKLFPNYNELFNGKPIFEELLKPTRLYTNDILPLLNKAEIHGMAHITGGGIIENIPRSIPEGLAASVDSSKIPEMDIYKLIESKGVAKSEMYGTFNMGVGYVIISDAENSKIILESISDSFLLGDIVKDNGESVCIK